MKFMKNMMEPMMPKMVKGMSFDEKEEMMGKMMPGMMEDLKFEQKLKLMKKMMPKMMAKFDVDQIPMLMESMMPEMIKSMHKKGFDCTKVMPKMMPLCVRTATEGKTEEEKNRLVEEITNNLKNQV